MPATNFNQYTVIMSGGDAAGRLTKQTYDGGPGTSRVYFDYLYDPASNRTRLTFPDTPSGLSQRYYAQYKYDALNRPIRVCENENAAACGVSTAPLADVAYDALSRRQSVAYRNGTSAVYAYTARGDLTDHDWILPAAALDLNYDFTYNGVGQLLTERVNDPAQRWQPQANGQDLYEVNGLNQYKRIDAAAPVYDGNGNMTRDAGLRVFSYDAENMLRKAVNSAGALVADYDYYGDGTRSFKRAVWGGATTESRFFYSGDQEVLETDNASGNDLGANGVLRRYIRLPGSVDEPLVMIDYTLPANDNERWAHQNRLGSVVAVTDNTGALIERHTYSPYGVAGINNAGFPFRFTGQKLDPETGLYYYKARYYDPAWGRFLQTDPIGYEDDMNLYAYTGNDPINAIDPSGLASYLVCRDAFGGGHCFIVVTNDDDGSIRAQFSYGPQNNDKSDPGQLVELNGNEDSETYQDDKDAWESGKGRRNLNDEGLTDDDVVAAGNKVDSLVGTAEKPGPTQYKWNSNGKDGYANSNSAAARVLEEAKPGSSRNSKLWRRGSVGRKHPNAVGTAPKPPEPKKPRLPAGSIK